MANEELIIAQERLNAYYTAEKAILTGQSYTIGSRTLTRANLAWVRTQIDNLENRVKELQSLEAGRGRRKSYRITIRDL